MRDRIFKYFFMSLLLLLGGIVYFSMLQSNRIVIKSAAVDKDMPGKQSGQESEATDSAASDKQKKAENKLQPEQQPRAVASPTEPAKEPVLKNSSETAEESPAGIKKININTAGKGELMTLKGIGEKKAELILKYRQEKGSFQTIEEIMKIKGIKRKGFEKIKDYITVSEE